MYISTGNFLEKKINEEILCARSDLNALILGYIALVFAQELI